MGYDQWIQIDFAKEGCDAKTIKIALALAFPGIVEYLEECDTSPAEKETLHYERDGRHIWDDGLMLFEEFNIKEISEKLGCEVSVFYEGESHDDGESIEVVNGEIKTHRTLQWVDVGDALP